MVRTCRQWLEQYLTLNGECKSSDVKAAARDAGYSAPAASKAATALGVERSWSRTVPSRTSWRLPSKRLRVADPQARRVILQLVPHGQRDLAVVLLQAHAQVPDADTASAIVAALRTAIDLFEADAAA